MNILRMCTKRQGLKDTNQRQATPQTSIKHWKAQLTTTTETDSRLQTSKYSVFTFLPKNLYEQFRRVANSFFLLLILLQLLPEYYVVTPIVTAFPILIIVLITGLKDAFEDYKRHKNDLLVNNRITKVLAGPNLKNFNYGDLDLQSNRRKIYHYLYKWFLKKKSPLSPVLDDDSVPRWENVLWKDVQVGDILRLECDELVPADMVILSTSETECACYVETKNLDGETNLKLRQGPSDTSGFEAPEDFCFNFKCFLESEEPCPTLQKYHGTLTVFDIEQVEKKISISLNGVLLRGVVVKNTGWVTGIVFATGLDTKLILNSGVTPSKQSEMEKIMNYHIVWNLAFIGVLCLICSIGYAIWNERTLEVQTLYGSTSTDGGLNWFISIWSGLILFQNMVPISLYLTIEFAKTIQAYFIHLDFDMYHEESDTPCVPKSWNLADNLGQIEYIFSDKTGTLTRNIMEFKKCSIDGVLYDGQLKQGLSSSVSSLSKMSHKSLIIHSDWIENGRSSVRSTKSKFLNVPNLVEVEEDNRIWSDPQLDEIMNDQKYTETSHGKKIDLFFSLLAMCHTVLIDQNVKKDTELTYKAQSPDEACLVTTAAENNYVFKARKQGNDKNEISIDILGKEKKVDLLHILEFDSERKRMSVIIRDEAAGKYFLFCKGADSVIFERLHSEVEISLLNTTALHLENFAEEGLRTLCLAYREISDQFYLDWRERYHNTLTTVFPNPKEREMEMEKLHEEVETDLLLLGATAIEDKLQEGVPDCITSLIRAGIKIWVLTGDKMETAINIGFLCGLLKNLDCASNDEDETPNMVLFQIKHAHNVATLKEQLMNSKSRFLEIEQSKDIKKQEHALIIDGSSLKHAFEDDSVVPLLLDVACRCDTVICCRVSPLQKAHVVNMVKNNKKVVTLAIGDGANDVSMIQSAHVGVGISGEEGLQAAMSADYSIAQFRFLKTLLLVHGRWSYTRNSYLILNFNLKSLAFSLNVFWYQIWCGYSATVPYQFTYMLLFNTLFTSLPILALGIFDRDLKRKTCMKYPQIYKFDGTSNRLYSNKAFLQYMIEAIWFSAVSYFSFQLGYSEYPSDASGRMPDILLTATTMAAGSIISVNLSVAIDSQTWTWLHFLTYATFVLVFPAYIFFQAFIPIAPAYTYSILIFSQASFWLLVILIVIVSLGPRMIYYAASRQFFPSNSQLLHEIEQLKVDESEKLDEIKEVQIEKGLKIKIEIPLEPSSMTAVSKRNSHQTHHSVTYVPGIDTSRRNMGFSFAHTRGMANIILKTPYSYLSSKISRLGGSRSVSRASGTIETTIPSINRVSKTISLRK